MIWEQGPAPEEICPAAADGDRLVPAATGPFIGEADQSFRR